MGSDADQKISAEALAELERLRAENTSLRRELDETNRGVTALYLELDERAAELETLDRQKDEFLAMLGHELRNPLAAANAALHYLQHLLSDEDVEIQRTRGVLERQLHNLRRIVDDLLEVSRIVRGQVILRHEPLDLRACIRNALDAHHRPVKEAEHDLKVALPDQGLWGWFDSTRTEQVLANLLDNAIKYTPAGGRIEVRAARRELDSTPYAEIEVKDTGEGIDPARLPDVFKTFVQEERTLDRSRGGLGLGLSLVKKVVELHGGDIEAHSEGRGSGSTFLVRLPLDDRAGELTPERRPAAAATTPRRVLLVEDNDDLREVLGDLLALEGYEVDRASSGTEGIARFLERPPDVVFLDIGLPEIDGFTLARQMRARAPAHRPRLVALTGYGDDELAERIRDAGFDAHLIKPVDLKDLLGEIQQP